MSWPSSSTSPPARAPGTTSCMRLSVRMNVDFPHPDGPMSAVTCFGSIVTEMSSMALKDPNQADTCCTSMRFVIRASRRCDRAAPGSEHPGGDVENEDDEY